MVGTTSSINGSPRVDTVPFESDPADMMTDEDDGGASLDSGAAYDCADAGDGGRTGRAAALIAASLAAVGVTAGGVGPVLRLKVLDRGNISLLNIMSFGKKELS